MNDKMKDPECVTHRVKIAPPDYSRENYLATFLPQKQLTPEQIFWSNDLIEMKAEALKEQTKASRPIKALMMYPPNTPATLVPRVGFRVRSEITTPGFEQTKECYLTEVIPFLKTLKEHFEGIQKDLTKEIKEMKDIFEELEAEVDQNVVHRKHAEIERKNRIFKRKIWNNRKVHLDYLKQLKKSVETIREIVEETKFERPLDRSLASACLYTKHSQELLEYVFGTCPKDFNQ
ncbi:hypothetical protein Tco_1006674 [Tanacetum coccineum]|uniref:Uncharacterized protein n=1 Tax=Tanacetum coccineum TaxID=301880 RepID=A0ABQ5FID1_9ASTR